MADYFNTDQYNLASLIMDVEKQYVDDGEETLSVGMYGYMNAIFRRMMYNQIKLSSELSNEAFPTRARFDRNVLTHATFNNITDIHAVPSYMEILLCVPEEDFNKFLENNDTDTLIISKDCKIFIEEFEFHLDYDIKLSRKTVLNNQMVYTAMYDISVENLLSDITNPYISSPFVIKIDNQKFIYIMCTIRQIEKETISKKTITDNPIINKTLEFTFENQLASFEVYAKDDTDITRIIPIMEGAMLSDLDMSNKYCYYNMIDTNKIRIKFEPSQYIPTLNTDLEINVQTTQGASGSFTYTTNTYCTLEDDNYQYDGMQVLILPRLGKSVGASDKKSIADIKKLIQKEALSRKIVSTSKDLNNHFNSLNTDNMKVQVQEKIHNQFNRSFYAYLVLRNDLNNIVPTNTVNAIIDESKFADTINRDSENHKVNLVIKQGSLVGMKYVETQGWVAEILPNTGEDSISLSDYKFVYSMPFMTVISYNGPFASFYANVMKTTNLLSFTYINEISPIQFIALNFNFDRAYNSEKREYLLTIELTQNINDDLGVIEFNEPVGDEEPTIKENNLKVVAVLYNKENTAYRYMIADMVSYNFENNYVYTYQFKFETNDVLNEDNYIRIENTMQPNTENQVYGYFKPNPDIDIYVLNKFKNDNGDVVEYGRERLDDIIPNLTGYSVTNKYSAIDGISFFTNYSDIMSVNVTPLSKSAGNNIDGFSLNGLPLINYEYSKDEDRMQDFISVLNDNKIYIDNTLNLLENQFGIDFKFFNTYGPSNIYFLDTSFTKPIDRVNISITFEVKLKKISDENTRNNIAKDIKDILENIDSIESIHIPNIITTITNNYSSLIEYIEFKSIDEYGPGYQHIYRKDPDQTYTVPEMLTMNIRTDGTPDITIRVV